MVELCEPDAGHPHQLEVGEELVLRLRENPTTGFTWAVAVSGSGRLRMLEQRFEPGASRAVGAGGARVFRYVAESQGDVQLDAVERRSWEDDKPGRQSAVFRVTVR